jgi:hypothetical protein
MHAYVQRVMPAMTLLFSIWPTNLIGTEKLGYVGLLKLLTQATLSIQACPSSEDSDLVEREHEGAVGATNIDLSH